LALRDSSSGLACSWAPACEGPSNATPVGTNQRASTTLITRRCIVVKRTRFPQGKEKIPHALKCNADASPSKANSKGNYTALSHSFLNA
jgi:hypothetical protein